MLSKFIACEHQRYLAQLSKLPLNARNVRTLYAPSDFRSTLLTAIANAKQRIYIMALYLEQDDAGRDILSAIYRAKELNPMLEVCVLVDWHRAQRGRIGAAAGNTNADWYYRMLMEHPDISVPVYGVPVSTHEALGVLHLKGFIIDDTVVYSGASINDVYLHAHDKYRYDRYWFITNQMLADTMLDYIRERLLAADAVQRLDTKERLARAEIKHDVRRLRTVLRHANYEFDDDAGNDELAMTPLVGLGKHSLLNKTIHHLMSCTSQKLTICTPYFNLPALLVRNISYLLRHGKEVEIIVGDKTANDFFIPQNEPFKMIGVLPYLYEINLRNFLSRFQRYVTSGQLTVRLWKDEDNSYHLKGMWVDDVWQLITGNNLNPRAWHLDLENAVLIHDPKREMSEQRHRELECIRTHTTVIRNYKDLQTVQDYPPAVRKLVKRLHLIRLDRLVNRML